MRLQNKYTASIFPLFPLFPFVFISNKTLKIDSEATKGIIIPHQVIQGFIHDDHEVLINKHVMMIRVTDNI
jgi:hypothetical protein